MLEGSVEAPGVRESLLQALEELSTHCDQIIIACQTVHLFLEQEEFDKYKVQSLLKLTAAALPNDEQPLKVIASKTSRQNDLHGQWFNRPCEYIMADRAEAAIDAILKGQAPDMSWAEAIARETPLLLGCTEFSVALADSDAPHIIDPITLAAQHIVDDFVDLRLS